LLRPVEPPPPAPEPEVEPERELPVAETPAEVAWLDSEPEPEVESAQEPEPELTTVEPVAPIDVPELPVAEPPTEDVTPDSEPEPPLRSTIVEAFAPAMKPEPEPLRIEPLAITAVPQPVDEAEASVPEADPEPHAEPEPVPEPETRPEAEFPPAAAVPDDRDALIESLRDRVDAQEQEIAVLREQLEQERERKDVQVHVWPEEQPSPEPPAPSQPESYLLCVPTSAGYVLLDREGVLPKVGEPVAVPEQDGNFTVTKVVRLPRNGRPCAYLQRA
jgi:hypothetical protein